MRKPPNEVRVALVRARGLPAMDVGGGCDPFAQLACGAHRRKSKVSGRGGGGRLDTPKRVTWHVRASRWRLIIDSKDKPHPPPNNS